MGSAVHASPRLPLSHVTLLLSLYLAQGLPSGLVAHALPALLRDAGVGLELIGGLKLLALPWLLKFLWAPWVDRINLLGFGPHRGWILVTQAAMAMLLALAALFDPRAGNGPLLGLMGLLLLMNLFSSTQDIATDGLAVRLLPPSLRGLGNSLQVGGYKVGMIVSGSLLLMLVGQFGWRAGMLSLAALLAALWIIPLVLAPDHRATHVREPAAAQNWQAALRGFFTQASIGPWLAVMLTYKMADSMASAMIKPMLRDQGWDLTVIGQFTLVTSIVGLIGAGVGGWWFTRMSARGALLLFGLLQAAGLSLLAGVPVMPGSAWVWFAGMFEQFADGMATVALFAAMMGRCRAGHEGSDYTVQACLQLPMGGLAGLFGGVLAAQMGFFAFFVFAGLLSVLMLGFVWRAFPAPMRPYEGNLP